MEKYIGMTDKQVLDAASKFEPTEGLLRAITARPSPRLYACVFDFHHATYADGKERFKCNGKVCNMQS